jgi:hypothetical protein
MAEFYDQQQDVYARHDASAGPYGQPSARQRLRADIIVQAMDQDIELLKFISLNFAAIGRKLAINIEKFNGNKRIAKKMASAGINRLPALVLSDDPTPILGLKNIVSAIKAVSAGGAAGSHGLGGGSAVGEMGARGDQMEEYMIDNMFRRDKGTGKLVGIVDDDEDDESRDMSKELSQKLAEYERNTPAHRRTHGGRNSGRGVDRTVHRGGDRDDYNDRMDDFNTRRHGRAGPDHPGPQGRQPGRGNGAGDDFAELDYGNIGRGANEGDEYDVMPMRAPVVRSDVPLTKLQGDDQKLQDQMLAAWMENNAT